MQATTVTRVLVWSRLLRLTHWSLALSTIGLLFSGWLMNVDLLSATAAGEVHYLLTALLLPALLLRLYLLFFGHSTDHISDCEPNTHRLSQAWSVMRFYLTLGKSPLPKWYSHNPLWGPIYLLLLFFLVLSSISGLALLKGIGLIGALSLHDLHHLCYQVIGSFSILHIIAVFAHDLGGSGSDNSGMITGYRIFEVNKMRESDNGATQTIALNELLKSLKK
ncbi:MAG: cytochrome b/b6 domain-containing protein [Candidatus Thiodiazotropha sp. (ex Dulcina madagascariensis)]|nr:cytochrome b/b6 domain-containing protein [Candidatus Thiodiazotropha sp. (ex Dulcina madagascariensis)]MCU7927308.1 cytochrome b/b6 domain-containing protein [Candidatus Thiodiazotropha sp. (ex Dulcina madagascariensis)]